MSEWVNNNEYQLSPDILIGICTIVSGLLYTFARYSILVSIYFSVLDIRVNKQALGLRGVKHKQINAGIVRYNANTFSNTSLTKTPLQTCTDVPIKWFHPHTIHQKPPLPKAYKHMHTPSPLTLRDCACHVTHTIPKNSGATVLTRTHSNACACTRAHTLSNTTGV